MDESNEIFNRLPLNYTYLDVSQTTNERKFRIKYVKDKDAAERWLNEYSEFTKTSWRVARTYSSTGIYNVFKKDYHCCHFTDRRAKGMLPSKHTGCQAKLEVVVKRFIKKSKKQDMLNENYPCIVRIKNKHNHALNSAAAKNLNSETRQNFIDVLHCSPPLSAIKQEPEDFDESDSASHDKNKENIEAISRIEAIFNRIKEGIRSNPEIFLPASQKMIKNESKYAATETGLINAMHTFGLLHNLKQNRTKKIKKRLRKKKTRVQPTSTNGKKYAFEGGKNTSAAGQSIVTQDISLTSIKCEPQLDLNNYVYDCLSQ